MRTNTRTEPQHEPQHEPQRSWRRRVTRAVDIGPALPGVSGGIAEKSNLLVFFGSLFVFRLALDYGYIYFVHQQYESFYLAMRLNVNVSHYLLSLLLFTANALNLRPYQHSPANIFQLMASMFVVAPLTSQLGLDADRPLEPVLCTVAAFLLIRLITEVNIFRPKHPVTSTQGRYLALMIAISGMCYLLVWSVLSGAISNFNLNPELVYDFRRTVSSLMDIGPLAYVNLWVMNTFTIYLVCCCLEKKKYYLLIPLLAVQIYFTGISNHKGVVFMPIMVIGFWYFLASSQKLFAVPLATAALILLAVGIYQIWNYNWVAELALRRTFFVPSGATFAWFEYFSQQPFVYWSDSVLSLFVDTIYSGGPKIPYIVGEWLFPGKELAANNGLVSSGYSHAGYFGIVIYAIILGLIVNLINFIARSGVELWLATALTLVPLRTAISDSDLFTALLSHGILISILFLWLHRRAVPGPGQAQRYGIRMPNQAAFASGRR